MLFSVLIANYNNAKYLQTALLSVIHQSYANWEVILVDDGSTDDFQHIVTRFKDDKRIKIFYNQDNFGCGYTKRKCVEYATGTVLGFLDPDDALHPHALKIMVAAHVEKPAYSLISSTHFICNDTLDIVRIADYTGSLPEGVPYLLLGDGKIHHFAAFKKSFYDKTSGIASKNKRAVDQDLYYKLEEVGEICFIDQPLYYYRIHDGAISNAGNGADAKKNHYLVIEEACLRRIKKLEKESAQRSLIKKYRTKYYKIRIFNSFRNRHWLSFTYSLFLFPFVGGWQNIISYLKKLPKEGTSLLRQSFINHDDIKV